MNMDVVVTVVAGLLLAVAAIGTVYPVLPVACWPSPP